MELTDLESSLQTKKSRACQQEVQRPSALGPMAMEEQCEHIVNHRQRSHRELFGNGPLKDSGRPMALNALENVSCRGDGGSHTSTRLTINPSQTSVGAHESFSP